MLSTSATRHRQGAGTADPGRWELLRALGALAADPPSGASLAARSLGLTSWSAAEHTELFMLSLPPFASVHLNRDGKLGGEAADRVAGIWRVLGLDPPADADHLGALLALYAELGEAGDAARRPATRDRLGHARQTLLWEHVWSWLPGYLDVVGAHAPAARAWADLLLRAVTAETRRSRPARTLPLALRAAPEAVLAADDDRLLDALPARISTGCILTYRDLAAGADRLGLGLRRGERRFALRAMLEQDLARTLTWLADLAESWVGRHLRHRAANTADVADPARWWSARAAAAAANLRAAAVACRFRATATRQACKHRLQCRYDPQRPGA